MINLEKFDEVLKEYKSNFDDKHWEDEKYKWIAVKNFQDNWNLDAENFSEMLKKSLSKTENLLASNMYFPREMIEKFSNYFSDKIRKMFEHLYDESKDIFKRVEEFKNESQIILKKYNKETGETNNSHYQKENAIFTYLWLKFPDKYYIYKYSEVKKTADVLESDYEIKSGNYESNIRNFLSLYNEISNLLKKDNEIVEISNKYITEDCNKDENFNAFAIDFGYFIKNNYDKFGWEPKNYSPEITVEEWIELLKDREVFDEKSLKIMKRMKHIGEIATCKQLSEKYGENYNYYNGGSQALARKIIEKTNCKTFKEDGHICFWPILYLSKKTDNDDTGSDFWKLRDELSEALDNIDLEEIELYEPEEERINIMPKIWKISHGSFLSDKESLEDFENRKVVLVSDKTKAKVRNKLPQWEYFRKEMKNGDYFYLCYGNEIKLLGKIKTDVSYSKNYNKKAGKNEWYERQYEIIKESINNTAYKGEQKWWTPNDNSTCIEVPSNEKEKFEELILKPYFNLSLAELFKEENINYWWINANPKIWSFSDLNIGDEQFYTHLNENGNKRRVYNNFLEAKPNDVVIGYETTPEKKIVAIAKITKNENQKLYFEKIENLLNPIEYEFIKDIPELKNMEFFKNGNGSIFKLTVEEYNLIMDLIREENPLCVSSENERYTEKDFLDEVYMSKENYKRLCRILKRKKNIILKGSPGVGKTFTAKRLAYLLMGEKDDSRIEFVQFHQNYTYENFIMGYKPVENGFELKNGIFYNFCKKAENNPEKDYYFIIDEINRGNLSKIFGELLMLIENDYREEKATLVYSGLKFSVPKNLYIIGMMNTADRSLAMIDYALRRRFSFFEMKPGFESEGFKKYKSKLNSDKLDKLIEVIKKLNEEIENDSSLGRGFCIGHSYFCTEEDCTDQWLEDIVDFDIIPIIEEYWFDDEDKIDIWSEELKRVLENE